MAFVIYELCGSDERNLFSPHCWKARMSLAHKGLDFEVVPTPFTAIGEVEDRSSRTLPIVRDRARVISDSFEIALYLEREYPDRESLFAGAGGVSLARFVQHWTQSNLHSIVGQACLLEIHDGLAPRDQQYFRESRESRFGASLEEVAEAGAEAWKRIHEVLAPLESMLGNQPYIGGEAPLFADYIVFGCFQWMRMVSTTYALDPKTAVHDWFSR